MDEMEHKILDYIQHIWPVISGVFLFMFAGIKLWHHDKKQTKNRIITLEKLAENAATKADLIDCSKEKDMQHHKGIKDILIKLDKNTVEHGEILEKMNDQHSETLHKMLEMHNK